MAEFGTETQLQVAVDDRSLSDARRTIESELGDITVGVESRGSVGGARADGGVGMGGVGESMVDLQDEQVDLLESIDESLDGMGGIGGGGGGGAGIVAGAGAGAGAAGAGGIGAAVLGGAIFKQAIQRGLQNVVGGFGEEFASVTADRQQFTSAADAAANTFMNVIDPAGFGEGAARTIMANLDLGPTDPPEDPTPNRPGPPDMDGGGGFDPLGSIAEIQQWAENFQFKQPEWLKEDIEIAMAMMPPDQPMNLPQDPSNFGRPEEGPLGPGTSGREGRADQSGVGSTTVNRRFDFNISVEDRRDIDQEMRKIEQRLRDALRGNGGGI